MVEAAPASAFVMVKSEFLLEFLVVALDAPAQLCRLDEPRNGRVGGQSSPTTTPRRRATPSILPPFASCRRWVSPA